MMLKLLPPDDRRRDMIERSIAQARVQAGIDAAQIRVDIAMAPALERQLAPGSQLLITVTDGKNPLPVAVKSLPLGHFPQSVTLSDSDAMMPEHLLSSLSQFQVRVQVAPAEGVAEGASNVFGESAVLPYTSGKTVAITSIGRRRKRLTAGDVGIKGAPYRGVLVYGVNYEISSGGSGSGKRGIGWLCDEHFPTGFPRANRSAGRV